MGEAKHSSESAIYAKFGASSSKSGVHQAVGEVATPSHFVTLGPDAAGSPDYHSLLHADGAGTKSIVAYLAFRESGDPQWFKGLAQDCVVMNIDDIACVGAFEGLTLSNTIGRNRNQVPDSAISAIIAGYRECLADLAGKGISISFSGGETADVGDLVRTMVVDATMFARVKKSDAISTNAITAGDIIVGLSSVGQARGESSPNSGVGSNGLTLARHALIARRYADKYSEIIDPALNKNESYLGVHDLLAPVPELGMSVAQALLSPTRSYAPIVKKVHQLIKQDLHGVIHCTGGGQTKIKKFGHKVKYIKDNLFPCPPLFALIQKQAKVPWNEMYAVLNMGHRMELVCPAQHLKSIVQIAAEFGVEAKQIGRVESSSSAANELTITGSNGSFSY